MTDGLMEILGESWEVCPPEDTDRADEQINVIDSDGLRVATVFEWPEFPEKLLARGHLISAAPGLYVACEAMLRHIDGVADNDDLMACRARIAAEMAKARGEVTRA